MSAGQVAGLGEVSGSERVVMVDIDGGVADLSAFAGKYHELWHVEQSFRMSKTDLRARPIFHRTRDAIEANLTVVFTALAVSRVVQERSGFAIGKVVKLLRPLRSATIAINGTRHTFPPDVEANTQALLDRIVEP